MIRNPAILVFLCVVFGLMMPKSIEDKTNKFIDELAKPSTRKKRSSFLTGFLFGWWWGK